MIARKNIFLTGVPGVGKTTILDKALADLHNVEIAGYYTTRDITDTTRTFWLNDRITGERKLMAKLVGDRFEVDAAAFDQFAVNSIERSSQIVALDELGRFEEPCEQFKNAVYNALDSDRIVIGVLKASNNPFIETIKARKDVAVITVAIDDRATRYEQFAESLKLAAGRIIESLSSLS